MTLPSVVERPNRKQLEQSESLDFFGVLCVGVFLLLSFGAAQRHLQQAASFRVFLLRPFDRSRVRPAPPCREFGLRSQNRVRLFAEIKNLAKGTRDLERKRAERRKRGVGGACRVRVVPLEAPPSNYRGSCKEKNARQPSCKYAKWKLQKVSRMALSVSNLVEGGAEKEMEIKNGTASQTPRPP